MQTSKMGLIRLRSGIDAPR
jgi:hypothetical protein